MTLTSYGTKIDVRDTASRDRHPLIFSTFRSLGVGETMELIDGDDPDSLRLQFQAELPGQFNFAYVRTDPSVWRILITKLKSLPSGGSS